MAGRNHSPASLGGAYIPAPQHIVSLPNHFAHVPKRARGLTCNRRGRPSRSSPARRCSSRSRASSLRTSSRQPSDTVEIEVASNNALSTRRVQLPDRRRSSTAGANTAVSERARFSYRAGGCRSSRRARARFHRARARECSARKARSARRKRPPRSRPPRAREKTRRATTTSPCIRSHRRALSPPSSRRLGSDAHTSSPVAPTDSADERLGHRDHSPTRVAVAVPRARLESERSPTIDTP